MKSLAQKLKPYIAACCTGIWVETFEPKEATGEIRQLCEQYEWRLATWDVDGGFAGLDTDAPSPLRRNPCSNFWKMNFNVRRPGAENEIRGTGFSVQEQPSGMTG